MYVVMPDFGPYCSVALAGKFAGSGNFLLEAQRDAIQVCSTWIILNPLKNMAPQLVDLRGHIFRGGNTNQIPTRPLVYVRNSSFSAAKEENDTFTTQTISYTQARNI